MKTFILILVGVVLAGLWIVAPEYQKDKIYALVDSSPQRQCFEYHKKDLKDPDTAYLVTQHVSKYASAFNISVRAKNGYGAYGTVEFSCIQKDGELDDHAMLQERIDKLLGR